MTAGGILGNLIRLQAVYTRLAGASVADDVMITTHDFRQLDAVWPDDGTGGATHNYAALEATFAVWWNAIKTNIGAPCRLTEYRWYRMDAAGSSNDWGEPARVQTIATPIAGTQTNMLPPQMSCTITELTDSRRHWGRFYIPGWSPNSTTAEGRAGSSQVTSVSLAAQTLYNSWNNQGLKCVVIGSVKPDYVAAAMPTTSWIGHAIERSIGRGETDNRVRVAYDVRSVRMDDVLDVQRRRRYSTPSAKVTRAIT